MVTSANVTERVG